MAGTRSRSRPGPGAGAGAGARAAAAPSRMRASSCAACGELMRMVPAIDGGASSSTSGESGVRGLRPPPRAEPPPAAAAGGGGDARTVPARSRAELVPMISA